MGKKLTEAEEKLLRAVRLAVESVELIGEKPLFLSVVEVGSFALIPVRFRLERLEENSDEDRDTKKPVP